MDFLFRGVSLEHYQRTNGLLIPKTSSPFEYCFKWGEPGLKWGSGATYGTSEANAVVRHQLEEAGFPTSGVSTTPLLDRATYYATHCGRYGGGYVYKIDRGALPSYGVSAYVVRDYVTNPAVPEDEEVILVAADGILVEVMRL